jgi:hypothetical protein
VTDGDHLRAPESMRAAGPLRLSHLFIVSRDFPMSG